MDDRMGRFENEGRYQAKWAEGNPGNVLSSSCLTLQLGYIKEDMAEV